MLFGHTISFLVLPAEITHNIPRAASAVPPEDEQVMIKRYRGS
jgi:hypothetical protein